MLGSREEDVVMRAVGLQEHAVVVGLEEHVAKEAPLVEAVA